MTTSFVVSNVFTVCAGVRRADRPRAPNAALVRRLGQQHEERGQRQSGKGHHQPLSATDTQPVAETGEMEKPTCRLSSVPVLDGLQADYGGPRSKGSSTDERLASTAMTGTRRESMDLEHWATDRIVPVGSPQARMISEATAIPEPNIERSA